MRKNADIDWLSNNKQRAEVIEGIFVEKPDNVEVAVEMYNGLQVDFKEIVEYVNSAKNTQFYISINLDYSFDRESNYSYLWIDTGYKDMDKVPIMMEFKKEGEGYVYTSTSTSRKLTDNIKKMRPKYAGQIDKNYQKFIKKYKEDAVVRGMAKADIKTDKKTVKEKPVIDIKESTDGPSTMAEAMALALKKAGYKG